MGKFLYTTLLKKKSYILSIYYFYKNILKFINNLADNVIFTH